MKIKMKKNAFYYFGMNNVIKVGRFGILLVRKIVIPEIKINTQVRSVKLVHLTQWKLSGGLIII